MSEVDNRTRGEIELELVELNILLKRSISSS